MPALIELGSGIFHHIGLRRMAFARFHFIHEFLAHCTKGHGLDVERRDFGSQYGIQSGNILICRTNAWHIKRNTAAGNHLAFMAQQIFRNIPAAILFKDDGGDALSIGLGNFHIVKKCFAVADGVAASDVEVDEASEAVRVRREMEAMFGEGQP